MYRLLVSGSRLWDNEFFLGMIIVKHRIKHPDLIVVHGDCPKGADNAVKRVCNILGIPQDPFPADWNLYGKSAGFVRNKEMVDTRPDFGIFFIRGESKGTLNCLELAMKAGIKYRVYGSV